MTEDEIKRIIKDTVKDVLKDAVKQAIEETLARLGVDVERPLESQADFQHLRQWRQSVETVKRQGLITAFGIITVGVLGLIWQAVRGGTNGP